ncbi:SAM-dependent methyltransferase [Cellulomonas sp. NPDC057328]|uniref:SAM-dependent methyltransferase n=1 Tax=Cellulomonas sp. NPDC057328 TaxID=3346101 RepID=UPI0036360FB4
MVSLAARPAQRAALAEVLPLLRPDHGPVLDVGAGSGAVLADVLDALPTAHVLALEPSPSMRALALARVAQRPDWFARVTVRPEDVLSAPLPPRIGGALALGVLGHLDPGERAALLAELAGRLPVGGVALLDLQPPATPERVEAYEFTAATVGDLTYRGIAEAWPLDGERLRWRMTYLTLEGERVLVEESTEHEYHHPAPDVVAAEARAVGLTMTPATTSTFWVLTRT